MKRAALILTCLVSPIALSACAHEGGPRTAVEPVEQPMTLPEPIVMPLPAAPVLASNEAPAAAAVTPPATQPAALPPPAAPAGGGSDIVQMLAARRAAKPAELPSGHPDISRTAGSADAMPKLPSGHPDISKMQRSTSTQPAKVGSLTVRATQGTAGGPAIGSVPVIVELLRDEQVIDKNETKLSPDGTVTLDNVPVGLVVQPRVRVTYNGAEYEATGEVMDPSHPAQEVQVAVFETTEAPPAWQVKMQHLITQPTTSGVQVMEMLAVENPADRAWIGKPSPDGKRTTIAVPLPAGATNIQLTSGFHEGQAKLENGSIVSSSPLTPGLSQYSIAYTVPVQEGAANLAFTSPAPVKHLMVFVPDDGSTVKPQGLEAGGVADMGNGKTRFYKAADVPAGQPLSLSISGIKTIGAVAEANARTGDAEATAPASADHSVTLARGIAGAGGLAIFVVGGMLLLTKGPRTGRRAKAA